MKRLKAARSSFPIMIMTGHGDVPLAVEAMKLGAVDFLEKPFEDDRLIGMIETAIREAEPAAKSEAVAARHRRPRRQPQPARAPGDGRADRRPVEQG